MYHALGGSKEAATRFVLPVKSFERQMRLLATLPFSVVPLEQAATVLLAGGDLPRGAIALTFDDGTRDTKELALPVLERYGFPATAFVVSGKMGSTVDWTTHAGLSGRATMTWDEALALEPVFTLQPHTRTHPSLRELSGTALADEVEGSRRDLEEHTGRQATVFAYPYGHYEDHVVAAVEAAEFSAACSVKPGRNDSATPRYELRRSEVHGDRSLRSFLELLLARS